MTKIRNKVQLIGNLGRDPEMKEMDHGRKMVKCTLAINDYYRDHKGETKQKTYWHHLVAWGPTAERMAKKLRKGSELAVEGQLVSRQYEAQGQKKYITEVLVDDFIKLNKEEAAF